MKRRGQKKAIRQKQLPVTAVTADQRGRSHSAVTGFRHWMALGVLFLLLIVAYSNSFKAGFTIDNRTVILDDPRVKSVTAANLKGILTEDYWPDLVTGTYRPLTTMSYLFNYAVMGSADQPTAYHAVNFLLHAVNTGLVYLLAFLLFKHGWAALVTAAVFGFHPVATEAVTNIAGRAELLATLSVLLGTLCHIQGAGSGPHRRWWLAGLMFTTLAGAFCNESAVAIVGVVVLYDLAFRLQPLHASVFINVFRNLWTNVRRSYWVLLPPVAVYFLVRASVYHELIRVPTPFVDNPLVGTDFWTSRMTAVGVMGRYLGLLFWPQHLSCDYSFNQIPLVTWQLGDVESLRAIATLVLIIGLMTLLVTRRRVWPELLFFAGFFFVTILPTSNLVFLIGSTMADRFLYLPSIGFAGCVGWLLLMLNRRVAAGAPKESAARTVAPGIRVAAVVVALALGARTYARNLDWQNDGRLWAKAAEVSPHSYNVHSWLAWLALGNELNPKDIDGCIREAEIALQIIEKTPPPDTNQPRVFLAQLGAYYRIKGDSFAQRTADGSIRPTEAGNAWYHKALDVLRRSAALDRAMNLAKRRDLERSGRPPEEIVDAGLETVHSTLGDVLLRLPEYDQALAAYNYYRHLNPTQVAPHLRIATLELARNQLAPAVVALLQALAVDPKQAPAWKRVKELHAKLHPDCPPLAKAGDRPALNLDCPLYREHVCTAYGELYRVFLKSRLPKDAERLKESAANLGFCPPLAYP